MALGTRRQQQTSLWVEAGRLQARGRHPFYSRVNEILERAKFDSYAERICRKYYAKTMGRPSIVPGVYFRCFLMGYFEGIDSERGIAYRVSDSLRLREFLGLSLEEQTPDPSTLSKTRRLMNLGTHEAVFRWVLKRLAGEGLLSGKNLGVDATTLEANAALKSIVRRDNGAAYDEHVSALMKTEGVEEPTPAQRQRFDRKRKKKLSNRDWVSPHDREARIMKMKDGRTHLAYKAEHAVDLETGAVVAVTVATGDAGDTATILETLPQAGEHIAEVACTTNNEEVGERVHPQGPVEAVADKGYHSNDTLQALGEAVVRTYISEPDRGQRHWQNKPEARQAVYDSRRRIRGEHGKKLLRRRGGLVERSFAHAYETGGMRRVHLRGRDNVLKRMLIHVGGFNLSLVMRKLLGKGTPRGLQGLSVEDLLLLLRFWVAVLAGAAEESASTPMFMSSHALPSRFLLYSRQNERISSATGC